MRRSVIEGFHSGMCVLSACAFFSNTAKGIEEC